MLNCFGDSYYGSPEISPFKSVVRFVENVKIIREQRYTLRFKTLADSASVIS